MNQQVIGFASPSAKKAILQHLCACERNWRGGEGEVPLLTAQLLQEITNNKIIRRIEELVQENDTPDKHEVGR